MKALKIVSGGQTGVDRAALDVALRHGTECGGWCPDGRLDEFGKIPGHYPIQELQGGGFTERTLQNVKDSDGTVIIYEGEVHGGTERTVQFCIELARPHRLIDASRLSAEGAANLIADFVRENDRYLGAIGDLLLLHCLCSEPDRIFTDFKTALLSWFRQREHAQPSNRGPEQSAQASCECQDQSSGRRKAEHLHDEHVPTLVSSEVSGIECARDIYKLCQCLNCERGQQTDLCSD